MNGHRQGRKTGIPDVKTDYSYIDGKEWICPACLFRFPYFRATYDGFGFFDRGAAGSRR